MAEIEYVRGISATVFENPLHPLSYGLFGAEERRRVEVALQGHVWPDDLAGPRQPDPQVMHNIFRLKCLIDLREKDLGFRRWR